MKGAASQVINEKFEDFLRFPVHDLEADNDAGHRRGCFTHKKECHAGLLQISMEGEDRKDETPSSLESDELVSDDSFGNQTFCQISRSVGP